MSPSKLGLFASLALATNAVLIPPSMTVAELGDDNALETLAISPFKRRVLVECPECPVAHLDNGINWQKEDTGNAFLVDFFVGPNEDTFSVGGAQLYPPTFNIASQDLRIAQIDVKAEKVPVYTSLQVTGYTFHFDSAETVNENGMELLPMTFQITSIEGTAVKPQPLTINLLKDTSGRLMIASFDSKKTIDAPPMHHERECKQRPSFCKWRAIMADRIEKLKHMGKGRPGCHKRPHGHHNPMEEETFEGKPPHRFRPGGHHRPPHHMEHNGHGHHGHDHHHGHHQHMHIFLRRAFFTILVPILIGIFAGTLTYLIGMALGCLIAITVAKFRGQSYQPIALEDDVEEANVEVGSEKHEYAELPAYEAPPVYQKTPAIDAAEATK